MAPHSSTPAWKIPWMEEPGRLQSWGRWVSDTIERLHFTFHFHALEKEMATHSSVLAWRIPGTAEPGGLLFMGSQRVRHDWSDLAVAVAVKRHKHPQLKKGALSASLEIRIRAMNPQECWVWYLFSLQDDYTHSRHHPNAVVRLFWKVFCCCCFVFYFSITEIRAPVSISVY